MSWVVRYGKALRCSIYMFAVLLCAMVLMLIVNRYQHQQQVFLDTAESLLRQQALAFFERVRAGVEVHRLQPDLLTSILKRSSRDCLDESEQRALQTWAQTGTDAVLHLRQRVLTRTGVGRAALEAPMPVLAVANGALNFTSTLPLARACDSARWLVFETQTYVQPRNLRSPELPFSEDALLHVAIKLSDQLVGALDIAIQEKQVLYFPAAAAPNLPWSLVSGQSQMNDGRFEMTLSDERTGVSVVFASGLLGESGLWSFLRVNAFVLALFLGLVLAMLGMLTLLRHTIGVGERLHHLSTRDPLTGLYNRRAAMERACAERARALRTGRGFCVVQIDIDHFKRINDSFGHDGGDVVLQFFATCLESAVRQGDMVARLGGEEFLMLLPETDLQSARQVVERLRQMLHETQACYGQQRITVTSSFGLSAWSGVDESLAALLVRADRLLYQAKQQGRDRCVDDLSATAPCAQPRDQDVANDRCRVVHESNPTAALFLQF